MSWVTVIWSMLVSACLTLAMVHVLVWWRNRAARTSLLFCALSVGTAVFAGAEVWMMRAETPGQFGDILRWAHVSAWVVIVAMVGFVRLYLGAGRPWLAWTVCGLRTISLLPNFLTGMNINYQVVTGLRRITFLGESVVIPEGVTNPWMLVGQLSLLTLLIFVADAVLATWRRGDQRQALVLGGAIGLFTLTTLIQSVLVMWGWVELPLALTVYFMPVIGAMNYEMSREVFSAAKLARELRESQQQMELAAAATHMGMWSIDLAGRKVWASAQCRVLFGFAPEERLDLDRVLQRVHPEDRASVQSVVTGMITEHQEADYRVVLPEGQIRWLASRGRVELGDEGRPARVHIVSLDITQRHQAEEEAKRKQDELAHVSRSVMLGELSASLAHELNQPLGAILRNTEAAELFLQQPTPDLEELRAILADIRQDDQRAAAVISRMRAFLQRHEVERQPVDLNQLVTESISLVRPDAAFRRVQVEFEPGTDLPLVTGDRIQLQQVLLNLVLNAMDAMQDTAAEARRITVRACRAAGQITVAVSDTGGGIPPDKLARIFEPFFTTKPKGLGMGLSISRTIVETHGGRLMAENNPAGGATFSFTLPVASG